MAITTAVAAVAGVGLSAAGAIKSSQAAKQQNQYQQQIIGQEQAVEAQRQKAMELDARRRQLEVFRNVQRARSLALTNATAQGASQGSGLQGGYGQIAGEGGSMLLGINQGLEVGRDIFGINSQMSQSRIGLAQAGQGAALGAGLTSLGGSIINSLGTINKLSSGWGPSSSSSGQGGMGLYSGNQTGNFY